jgi:hypothetical protein
MRRWLPSDPYWLVTDPATGTGFGVKALTPEEAARRALAHRSRGGDHLRAARTLAVASHCGVVPPVRVRLDRVTLRPA